MEIQSKSAMPCETPPTVLSLKSDVLPLTVLLFLIAALEASVYASGYPGASGDDFFRALLAYEWAQRPFVISKGFGLLSLLWFPAHFWITGTVYKFTSALTASLTGVSFVFYMLQLVFVFLLSKKIFDRWTAYLSVALAGLVPWQIWLGISMTAMPLYLAFVVGAMYFLVCWMKDKAMHHLYAAACLFMLATTMRPEGWIFSALFFMYMLVSIRGEQRPLGLVLPALISCVFIFFWLGHNYLEFGSPLYFLKGSKEHISGQAAVSGVPMWVKAVQYPALIFIVSPFVFFLSIAGAVSSIKTAVFSIRSKQSAANRYLLFVLLHLALMTGATLYGAGTTAAPQRYVMATVVLLVPFAANAVIVLWGLRLGRVPVVLLMALFAALGIYKAFNYSPLYVDTVRMGKYLGNTYSGGKISSEFAFRKLNGLPLKTEKEFMVLASAQAGLEAYSGLPGAFLLDILKVKQADSFKWNKELFKWSKDSAKLIKSPEFRATALNDELTSLGVQTIVLQSRELMALVPETFTLQRTIGSYAVFSIVGGKMESVLNLKGEAAYKGGKALAKGVTVLKHKYRGGPLPASLSLLWKLDSPQEKNQYNLAMSFKHTGNLDIGFKRVLRPIFHWSAAKVEARKGETGQGDAGQESVIIEDNVPLYLPLGMPSGDYSIEIALMREGEHLSDSSLTLTLPPVTLVSSKREVLAGMLKPDGEGVDLGLLFKVLLTL